MDYETTDKWALRQALIAMLVCPNCRDELKPVAFADDVYGCGSCKETWHLPTEIPSWHTQAQR